ncbi:MAG: hypothetical protein EP343_33165 [Deltaproteobacteria bacterium]|nr:MAG: hypothetical protein EP343_33165 [Deltaproteobacteria bacterium]
MTFFERIQRILNHGLLHSLVIIGAVLLMFSPLLSAKKLIDTHDLFFHQRRTVEYYEAIKKSPNTLPIWSENAVGGMGRPFFLYAAPLVQWTGSALLALTGNSIRAIHLLALLLALLSAFGVLLWLRECSPPYVAFLATISFLGTDYFVRNILARGALAEVAAMAMFTIVLWLTERYLRTGKVALLGGAFFFFTLVVLAHNLSIVFLAPFVVVYSLFGGWRYDAWKRAWFGVAIPIVGMIAASFFWVPAIVHSEWINADKFASGFSDIRNHFMHAGHMFQLSFTSLIGKAPRRFTASFWTLSSVMGLTLFVLLPGKPKPARRFVWVMIIGLGACLFFLSELSKFVWVNVPYIRFLQFPWRLLVICSLFCAGISTFLFRWVRWKFTHVLLVGVILIPPIGTATYFGMKTPQEDRIHLETPNDIRMKKTVSYGYTDISAPRCVRVGMTPYITTKTLFRADKNVKLSKIKSKYAWRQAHYETKKGGAVILRNAYFPLWDIRSNGEPLSYRCVGSGFIEIYLPPGKGVMTAKLSASPLMVKTRWISFIVFLFMFLLTAFALWKKWVIQPHKTPTEPLV